MTYRYLDSTCINYVGYNHATGTMEVCFHRTGLYTLSGVPEYHFRGLINASSAGRYWNEHLRGKY